MEQTPLPGPESLFALLADETRLRIIRALADGPLTVRELTEVLAIPQSTASRHLGLMRRGELVGDRRDGTFIWYSLADSLLRDEPLMAVIRAALARLPSEEADRERLRAVLDSRRARTRDFFDALAGSYHNLARPGGGTEGLAIAMMMALGPCTVVDLGSGQGEIALRLARLGHRVIAVDSAPAMIRELSQRALRAGLANVEAHVGDIEAVPLPDNTGDVVLLSQSLHHTRRPSLAIAEAARVCRPGGRVVVIDLLHHEQEWVRSKLGDLWLGFEPAALRGWLEAAGLTGVVLETAEVESGLPVISAAGTRP